MTLRQLLKKAEDMMGEPVSIALISFPERGCVTVSVRTERHGVPNICSSTDVSIYEIKTCEFDLLKEVLGDTLLRMRTCKDRETHPAAPTVEKKS